MSNEPQRLTNKQIAAHFGFTTARAAALIREGMPVTSLAEAEAWRHARLLRGQRGGVEQRAAPTVNPADVTPDDDFDETVERHRELKEAARMAYMAARDSGDPHSNKLYMTYQNVLKTLVQIEREALARRIESKELIRTAEAMERFGRVIGEIKGDLLGLANSVASQANPDNQGKAFKVIDEKVNALLKKWSNSAGMVISEMTEQTVNTKGADLEAFGEEE